MPCKLSRDEHGTSYHIAEDKAGKTPGGQPFSRGAAVEVWWARRFAKDNDETLFIRQEGRPDQADVVELTLGQVYDVIHALGWAILKQ